MSQRMSDAEFQTIVDKLLHKEDDLLESRLKQLPNRCLIAYSVTRLVEFIKYQIDNHEVGRAGLIKHLTKRDLKKLKRTFDYYATTLTELRLVLTLLPPFNALPLPKPYVHLTKYEHHLVRQMVDAACKEYKSSPEHMRALKTVQSSLLRDLLATIDAIACCLTREEYDVSDRDLPSPSAELLKLYE